jgi:alpha-ketoglutaric semialdehyde dehydrogenase
MKPALLLVDLQNDFLTSPGLLPPAAVLVERAAFLLDACRRRRLPIVHIRTTVQRENDRRLPHWRRENRWLCVDGTPGHQSPKPLQPLAGEVVIDKTGFNAFADGRLEKALRQIDCDTVIVAGLHLHACVRTVAAECLERGRRVHVAEDAVASNDPIHAAATRRWLADRCVEFEPAGSLIARLDGAAPSLIHRSPRLTDEVLFEIPIADRNEVVAAGAAARQAWNQWRRTAWRARQILLEDVSARLEAAAPELARRMALEIGKPHSHGLEEIRRATANIRDVARRASANGYARVTAGLSRHQSLGVIAVISPWNNPVAIPLGKIAPALAYGNTVVWKPAPAATRLSLTLLKLLHDAGVPRDAVRLATGDHTTARFLAANEDIHAVTLTGSSASGYALQEICGRRLVPLQAELSGNNAAIVWSDADLKAAAAQIAWGAFGFAGQRCTANRRLIVSPAQFEPLLQELQAAAEQLAWGEPLDPATEIGPVISAAKRDEVAALVAGARADGDIHRVVTLQQNRAADPGLRAGAYAPPSIVCCDRPDHTLVQEETMGPVLVVQRAEDFEHALELCNGVRHGLASALFSRSADWQKRFLESARAGVLKLNAATAGVDVTLPFGGWKASGIGPPEHGEGDRLFYTRLQTVYGAGDLAENGS